MKQTKKNISERGFTLIEVIVTLAILALFSTALVSTFKQAVDTVTINRDTTQMYLEAKEALQDMSYYIQSATLLYSDGYFFSTDSSTGLHSSALSSADQLHCITKINNESTGLGSELYRLGYWIYQRDSSNTYNNTLERMLETNATTSSAAIGNNYSGAGDTIASQIVDLDFKFLDHTNVWQTQWDSRTIGGVTGSSIDDGKLPKAVKITIWMINKKKSELYKGNFTNQKKYAEEFTTIVYIPESKKNY